MKKTFTHVDDEGLDAENARAEGAFYQRELEGELSNTKTVEAGEQERSVTKRTVEITSYGNFSSLHKQGAERYRGAWLCASMATAEHARSRTNVSDSAMKELLSLVTLRVLMALEVDGWLKPTKAEKGAQ